MKNTMKDLNLEEIASFYSYNEFLKFKTWIEEQVDNGYAKEIKVENYYAGINFQERWFEFDSQGDLWRLVYPDSPFYGYWGRVSP